MLVPGVAAGFLIFAECVSGGAKHIAALMVMVDESCGVRRRKSKESYCREDVRVWLKKEGWQENGTLGQ